MADKVSVFKQGRKMNQRIMDFSSLREMQIQIRKAYSF